jgi:hypothetical protein
MAIFMNFFRSSKTILKIAVIAFSLPVFASFPPSEPSTQLGLNDVSVLLPLPGVADWSDLPSPSDGGERGQLLPKELVTIHTPTLLQFTDNSIIFEKLKLIGIRFDPCFGEGLAPVCSRQIRLVWQPLEKVVEGTSTKTSTMDITLHSFYVMDADEFSSVLSSLKKLKADYNDGGDLSQPLQIHPLIKREGLKGEYFQKLKRILFKHAGENNLTRLTFMSLFAQKTVWFFGGINIGTDGSISKITIPRIGTTLQQFMNTATPVTNPNQFKGRIFPAPEGQIGFNSLIADSQSFTRDREDDIRRSAELSFEFENPLRHNPGTLDCVSCHVANQAKNWVFSNWDFTSAADYENVRYNSRYNLTNVSPLQENTAVVRMFGYFDDKPFASQRVINESAEILKFLE